MEAGHDRVMAIVGVKVEVVEDVVRRACMIAVDATTASYFTCDELSVVRNRGCQIFNDDSVSRGGHIHQLMDG